MGFGSRFPACCDLDRLDLLTCVMCLFFFCVSYWYELVSLVNFSPILSTYVMSCHVMFSVMEDVMSHQIIPCVCVPSFPFMNVLCVLLFVSLLCLCCVFVVCLLCVCVL